MEPITKFNEVASDLLYLDGINNYRHSKNYTKVLVWVEEKLEHVANIRDDIWFKVWNPFVHQ